MTRFRARWVLPIDAPPIEDGFVDIENSRILALGRWSDRGPRTDRESRTVPDPRTDIEPGTDLGDVALLPGLVNAHTHLELSWMAGRVPPQRAMDAWIRALMDVRRAGPDDPADVATAAQSAIAGMRESGTVLVGDISNTLVTAEWLAQADLGGVVFHEVIGFAAVDHDAIVRDALARTADAEKRHRELLGNNSRSYFSVVAHAPYSVAPGLIAAIARARRDAPLAIHLGESVEEMEFIATGQGPMRAMLEGLGVWTDAWPVPACDPAEYIDRLGYLQPGTLVVHGVHLPAAALDRIRTRGAVLVSCPRSNRWVGAGPAPLSTFYRSGVPVAFGTDSLASASSLNLFDELAEARRAAADVPARALLESATRIGANALGLGADYGTIAPGKRDALIAVRLPVGHRGDASDVEEYLVSGDVRAPQDVRLIRSR